MVKVKSKEAGEEPQILETSEDAIKKFKGGIITPHDKENGVMIGVADIVRTFNY